LPLIAATDGAFYGTVPGRAVDPLEVQATAGFIFRLGHAISLRYTPGVPVLNVTGVPGYTYGLERSLDLSQWSMMQTFVLPASGVGEFTDSDPLRETNAFYRLRAR